MIWSAAILAAFKTRACATDWVVRGSTRVPRVGFGVPPKPAWQARSRPPRKRWAGRPTRHARRVRSPESNPRPDVTETEAGSLREQPGIHAKSDVASCGITGCSLKNKPSSQKPTNNAASPATLMSNKNSIYVGLSSFATLKGRGTQKIMGMLFYIITLTALCTVCMCNDAQYKVDFAIVKKKVVITVENLSDTKLPMYVDSSMNYGIPAGFSVKVKNKNNQIVSIDSSRYPYGYWSPRMRESGFLKLPLKERSIAPKSCRKITVPLEPLLQGFWIKMGG